MKHFIKTLKVNRQLTIAIASSFILIGIIVLILSKVKTSADSNEHNTDTSGSEYLYAESDFTTTDTENTRETDSSLPTDSEPATDKNGNIISDLDFTLPEDQNEEPETTLPASEYPYLIKVNRLLNCVTVYTKNSAGEFTVPYKAMACSTGKYINNTPLGTFRTSSKYNWRLMVDGTHSQYATRVYGGILFHSVPCYRPSKDQLEVAEFNKLGSPASLGCIRLTVQDSKWIHDNCPSGTTVIIYDDADSPGPLGKPSVIKIPENSPFAGWDPTDPDAANPWNNCSPSITASDVTIPAGSSYDIRNNVTAADTCGNDITSSIMVNGSYDINTPGSYPVTFSVTDLLGRSASVSIILTVTSSASVSTETVKPTETDTTRPKETTSEANTTTKETTKETTKKPSETTDIPEETTKKQTPSAPETTKPTEPVTETDDETDTTEPSGETSSEEDSPEPSTERMT